MNLSALRVRMFTSLCEIKQVFGAPKFLRKPRGFLKRCKEQDASVGAAPSCLRVLLNHPMKRFIAGAIEKKAQRILPRRCKTCRALKLVDDEGSALVGTEFVGWLTRNCQFDANACLGPCVFRLTNKRGWGQKKVGGPVSERMNRASAAAPNLRIFAKLVFRVAMRELKHG